MSEFDRGTDRAGRRGKRLLSPSQKYEIWLQLVRQEVTIAEAAAQQQVDRSTIMRIRTVAKEGALAALAASKPGVQARERDYELESARAEVTRLSETVKEMAVKLMLVEGKAGGAEWPGPAPGGRGHQGRAAGPARRRGRGGLVDPPGPVTSWSSGRSGRTAGWPRRAAGRLEDAAPGGSPVHGLLAGEVAEILALFDQWGETDRSHRKLAPRGS